MEHHVSSSAGGTANPYAQARINLYGISGIPNTFFDGITNVLGGSSGSYDLFLAKYNQRIAVDSDFSIMLNGMADDLDYTVGMTIDNVVLNSSDDLVAHLALTESNVLVSGSYYEHVTRRLWPDEDGTPIAFTSAESTETVVLEFEMDEDWDLEHCEFIAFVQDNSTKEILQATKVMVMDMLPLLNDNAGVVGLNLVPITNCQGSVEPLISLINEGATNLSTVEISYQVNDEEANVYSWSGDLSYGGVELVSLPAIDFDLQEENSLTIFTFNPNGNQDEDPENDTTGMVFTDASHAVPDIYLFLKLDNNPEETSWILKNSSGDILYEGGDYTQQQQFVKDTFELSEEDCYTFLLFDEGGDGLTGSGYFALRDGDMDIIYENYNFESHEEGVQFSTVMVGVNDQTAADKFSVYPNPFSGKTNISFTVQNQQEVEITVFNVVGDQVMHLNPRVYNAGRHVRVFDAEDQTSGIYFVRLKIGDEIMTKKISLF